MKFVINVGKKIIHNLKNARMKQNVSIAKETMPLMTKHVQNGKRKRKFKESRQKGEFHTQMKQMDIFNSVKTLYAQAAAATKRVVKTVKSRNTTRNVLARRHKTNKKVCS